MVDVVRTVGRERDARQTLFRVPLPSLVHAHRIEQPHVLPARSQERSHERHDVARVRLPPRGGPRASARGAASRPRATRRARRARPRERAHRLKRPRRSRAISRRSSLASRARDLERRPRARRRLGAFARRRRLEHRLLRRSTRRQRRLDEINATRVDVHRHLSVHVPRVDAIARRHRANDLSHGRGRCWFRALDARRRHRARASTTASDDGKIHALDNGARDAARPREASCGGLIRFPFDLSTTVN